MNFVSAQGVKFILVYFPIKHIVVRVDFRLFELMALANREKQRHFVLVFYLACGILVSQGLVISQQVLPLCASS